MIGYWLGQQQARECREMCARAAEWLSGRQDGALEESRLESAVAEALMSLRTLPCRSVTLAGSSLTVQDRGLSCPYSAGSTW